MKADILKDDVAELVKRHDAAMSAVNPSWSNPQLYKGQIEGYKAIISRVKKSRVRALLVVGGAGSLEVAPGVQLIDVRDLAEQVKKGVVATKEVLHMLTGEKDVQLTFLSPPSIAVGERRARYRVVKDQVLKNEDGESRVSTQDYAVAMIDELENPQHIRERFTVAY